MMRQRAIDFVALGAPLSNYGMSMLFASIGNAVGGYIQVQ
jgi:hypothetical protein